MFKAFVTLAALCALSASASAAQLSFLHVQGRDMVNEAGQKVHLRGTGLGHWLLPEAYMWKLGNGADRPRKAEALIEKLIGKPKKEAFFKLYTDRYITAADIQRIRELGFNSVRPALNARLLMDEATGQLIPEGFKRIDDLIGWCKAQGLYVILDLHGAPGGQTGKNIDDSPRDQPELFTSEKFAERCERLWV